MSTRISKDVYYINIAKAAALGSTCNRAKVGAVIVKNNIIIGTGYNGSLPGMEHCKDDNCSPDTNCLRTTHAEINALERAIRVGFYTGLPDSTIYTTLRPCYSCLKTLAAFGIREIVYEDYYVDEKADKYIEIAKLSVFNISDLEAEQG